MTSKEKKEFKNYLCYLADNEFNKYLRWLDYCKDAMKNNDAKTLEFCLNMASMSLKQSASYRVRSINGK